MEAISTRLEAIGVRLEAVGGLEAIARRPLLLRQLLG